MFKSLFATAAAALVVTAVPAQAENPPTRTVGYGDLDLGSPQGRQALSDRIRWAVKSVCGTPEPLNTYGMRSARKCRRAAADKARRDADVAIAQYQAQASQRLAARN